MHFNVVYQFLLSDKRRQRNKKILKNKVRYSLHTQNTKHKHITALDVNIVWDVGISGKHPHMFRLRETLAAWCGGLARML